MTDLPLLRPGALLLCCHSASYENSILQNAGSSSANIKIQLVLDLFMCVLIKKMIEIQPFKTYSAFG